VDTEGAFTLRTQPITSHVADNGVVHVVAGDPEVRFLGLGVGPLLCVADGLGMSWLPCPDLPAHRCMPCLVVMAPPDCYGPV